MTRAKDVAAVLTREEAEALCGRFVFRSMREQEHGEATLYRLGLWKTGYFKRGETMHTPLGLEVRAILERSKP